ncbi:MAG TPA: HEAT repeat domain-containing protein [Chroococcales cyanobacterium]
MPTTPYNLWGFRYKPSFILHLKAALRYPKDGETVTGFENLWASFCRSARSMTHFTENYLEAGHPNTHETDLRKHARHDHHLIRLRVAEHRNSPLDLLRELAQDDHPEIRIAVAEHPDATDAILRRLCSDKDVDVRYALAENAALATDLLSELADDENPYVAYRARRTLQSLGKQ